MSTAIVLRIIFRDDLDGFQTARAVSDHLTKTFNDDNSIEAIQQVDVDWIVEQALWADPDPKEPLLQ